MTQRSPRFIAVTGALLLGAALTQTGCSSELGPEWGSTPTLTRQERYAEIQRNWGLELQMMNDDIDHLLLLRPVSGLTEWNVPQP